MQFIARWTVCTAMLCASLSAFAEDASPEIKKKLEEKFSALEKLASSPAVTKAVAERNKAPSADLAGMNQDKWKAASVLDKAIRGLAKNDAAEAMKQAQTADSSISEGFLSASDGTKVAFIAKPTNWSHKGKPKHDDPMAGKRWVGPVEIDSSSGVKQIQIAVPVMVDGKPAGSLVIGYQVQKL